MGNKKAKPIYTNDNEKATLNKWNNNARKDLFLQDTDLDQSDIFHYPDSLDDSPHASAPLLRTSSAQLNKHIYNADVDSVRSISRLPSHVSGMSAFELVENSWIRFDNEHEHEHDVIIGDGDGDGESDEPASDASSISKGLEHHRDRSLIVDMGAHGARPGKSNLAKDNKKGKHYGIGKHKPSAASVESTAQQQQQQKHHRQHPHNEPQTVNSGHHHHLHRSGSPSDTVSAPQMSNTNTESTNTASDSDHISQSSNENKVLGDSLSTIFAKHRFSKQKKSQDKTGNVNVNVNAKGNANDNDSIVDALSLSTSNSSISAPVDDSSGCATLQQTSTVTVHRPDASTATLQMPRSMALKRSNINLKPASTNKEHNKRAKHDGDSNNKKSKHEITLTISPQTLIIFLGVSFSVGYFLGLQGFKFSSYDTGGGAGGASAGAASAAEEVGRSWLEGHEELVKSFTRGGERVLYKDIVS